jgi:hypothetical protein
VLRSVYELVEREEMKIKTLERFHAYGPDDEPATHEIPFDDGEYCYARQALAAIAERDAEIERLRAENDALKVGTWQPINNSKVQCTQFETGGANQHHDYLVVWCDELNEGTVHLPDDVRLCRLMPKEK